MKDGKKSAGQTGFPEAVRPFVQTIAIAFVCIVFISLVFIMGLMDLRKLDKTLAGYMKNRSLDIIRDVQKASEYNFRRLEQFQQGFLDTDAESPFRDELFSLHENLIMNLVEPTLDIDMARTAKRLNDQQVIAFAGERNIWLIAFLNKDGLVTFANRPIPEDLLGIAGNFIQGDEEIKINLFNRLAKNDGVGFIVIRGTSGNGAVLLGLNREGFRYWCLKIAIQKAIEEVGQDPEMVYFQVRDQQGRILGSWGQLNKVRNERPGEKGLTDGIKKAGSKEIKRDEKNLLEIAAPFRLGSWFNGISQLSLKRDRLDRILKKERSRIFISMAFLVVIAILSMWFLNRNQKRHLAYMQEMERKLSQAERLSAMGRLAAGVAHEIRNPLNAISMASQRLEKNNIARLTAVMKDEIRRLNKIIEDFLDFAKARTMDFRKHDLADLLKEIVILTEEEMTSRGITIRTRWNDSPVMVSMDFDRLKQAIFNIFKNAMESISNEGSIELSVESGGDDWISLKISDTGVGMTHEEVQKIFNPDYSTKDKGLGLGLTIAHEIIRGHGGEILVRSQPGKGSIFEILLPGIMF